ncbi:helix-turn-helix transcriptional regulator [Mesorhizobium sp. YC-39]|uniref:helix-turn-helix transcriptional regulator n=1 Tax=unclassified Mesorhizobium TaxID=325217 RepID=UPI0021E891EC|nr:MULTISPECIES: helix-turn-helix transcriptional regulator [unclassified Mesorhizobium]MCV3208149.1 helix-turn-helix transcriptional regulator [Mesorhizobium sp. YC-2]MCV3229876.1 helix-turn-helix transcriptional regulator [Mesorhizobium sp. YC-39]
MEGSHLSALAAWHEALPDLVSLIGKQGFAERLDGALRAVAPFDLSCVFAYPGRARPMFLHDGLGAVSSTQIMTNYLNGTYLLDAVYSACARRAPQGLHRLRDLAPDAFFEGEYYNSPDVHPCISMESGTLAEEIVFLVPVQGSFYLAYSLLRANASPPFSDEDFGRLRQTAAMVTILAQRHWEHLAPAGSLAEPKPASQDVEQAFETFAPSRLTRREQGIVSLILRGHSSMSIGRILEIAEGTVKIHRKHIYAKLDISSQTELFNLFIKHLLAER